MGTGFITPAEGVRPRVSIVVPAFNEARRIAESIRKVDAFARESALPLELIVVNDGSVDATAEIVRGLGIKGLRLMDNKENHGKGYAVRQGALAASGDYVLFTDADLSAPIEELNKLLDMAVRERADIVIGSRNVDRGYIEKHQSPFREVGGMFFNLLVRLFLGLSLRDTQCGFKLFQRERTRFAFEEQTTSGFGFDPELLFVAKRRGLKICETPVRWSHAQGSKVNFLRDGTRMFFDLARIRWNAIAGKYS